MTRTKITWKKRLTLILLACTMVLPLAACVDTPDPAGTDTTLAPETTAAPEEERPDQTEGETFDVKFAEDFTVSKVFADDMIVQRGEKIRVWGFAEESENGKRVAGRFKGMSAEALIADGRWCLMFPETLEADTKGAALEIYTDKKTVTFDDVLVGDVYMILGQSNAAGFLGGASAPVNTESLIRLNRTTSSTGGTFTERGTDYVYEDYLNELGQWSKATQHEAMMFSSVGYHFAEEILAKADRNIPIGMIEIAYSGAPLGAFLPNEIAEKYGTDKLNPATGKYVTTGVNADDFEGRFIYNCHMAAWERYAIAGLIWYQGESDYMSGEAARYNEVFSALVEHLRGTHNTENKDFPVFVVEFPSIYRKPADFTDTWHFMDLGRIRATMGSLPSLIENCYVASSSDLWADRTYFNSLHPLCKKEQGARLAAIAAAAVLGKGSLSDAAGPQFETAELSADKKTVVITLANVGSGLKTKDGGTAVRGIVGLADKPILHNVVQPVSAVITGTNQITVTFDTPVKAAAYNYGAEDFFGETLNLCGSSGVPAAGFLTPSDNDTVGTYTAADFLEESDASVGFIRKSFDTLHGDGEPILPNSGIIGKLKAAGNKVEIKKGTSVISTYGWAAFKYDIILLGYAIDDEPAEFSTSPVEPQQAVLDAGGQYAKRFTLRVNTGQLTAGTHKVTLLALIDLDGGTPVKILEFDVTVTEN